MVRANVIIGVAAFVGAMMCAPVASAQQGFTRTTLQSIEYPGDKYVTETIAVTIAPHGSIPWHIHPGVEMGYVTSGSGTLSVKGQPEREVHSGDSWAIPAGNAHSLQNTGEVPESIVATYVVEKGKALSTPAQ